MALDEKTFEPEPVPIRVGQRVNTVGVAGNPRAVTAFQTHLSPVVLSQGDQAEMDKPNTGNESPSDVAGGSNLVEETVYKTVTSSLEGAVLVHKSCLVLEEK